jgi:aspartate kinase
VDVARRFQVPLHVRSSFTPAPGTVIQAMERIESEFVRGIACDAEVATLTVTGLLAKPAATSQVLGALGDAGIRTLLVVQTPAGSAADLACLLQAADLARAEEAVRPVAAALGAGLRTETEVAAVSVVGHAVHSHPGTAARILDALAAAGVRIELISSSAISLTCVVPRREAPRAQALLHERLGLDRRPASAG